MEILTFVLTAILIVMIIAAAAFVLVTIDQ